MDPLFLTLDEVLEIHRQQIDRYGGADGIRDAGALESALAQPPTTFEGRFLHDSVPAMAGAYLFHICRNHPFTDGNKRTGVNAAVTFLVMNGWEPAFDEDEFVDLALSVASAGIDKTSLIERFEARCHRIVR